MKTILITGINTGSAKHLLNLFPPETKIIGIYKTSKPEYNNITTVKADLTSRAEVEHCLSLYKPDEIYHLAGSNSNVYELDYHNNCITTKNILDSITKFQLNTKILVVGSSAEYGLQENFDIPVKESSPTNPVSFYGLTKLMQTNISLLYYRLYSIDIRIARTFNIFDTESRNTSLFIGKTMQQIDEIKQNKKTHIEVGNLEAKRDYINVQDLANGYKTIMDKGLAGEIYNIGSGSSIKINDVLKKLLMLYNLDISIIKEKTFNTNTKIDIPNLIADIGKIKSIGFKN